MFSFLYTISYSYILSSTVMIAPTSKFSARSCLLCFSRQSSTAASSASPVTTPRMLDDTTLTSTSSNTVSNDSFIGSLIAKKFDSTKQPSKAKTFKKYITKSLPKVPETWHISKKDVMLDMLFNNYKPMLEPIKQDRGNITRSYKNRQPISISLKKSKKSKVSTIMEDLETYQQTKKENYRQIYSNNYSPYFNNVKKFTPINSVFTNTILNTQQHNLELFNLPLKVVESLKPFQLNTKIGEEQFRDDILYVHKLEVEEKKLKQKNINKVKFAKNVEEAKQGKDILQVDDFEEYFGFK